MRIFRKPYYRIVRVSILTVLVFVLFSNSAFAQQQKSIVYLIPGQGADYRLFKNTIIDSTFDVKIIKYQTPEKYWKIYDFAKELSKQIDTTRKYYIIGVSLGGMLATEMADIMSPEKVIIISSAKRRKELPLTYRIQQYIPLYILVPGFISKWGALVAQPIFEPDRNKDKKTFVAMLKAKHPKFIRRTISMIITWKRCVYSDKITHIHGDNDNTIPIRNVNYDYKIIDGSHMMVLTRAEEINALINKILLSE